MNRACWGSVIWLFLNLTVPREVLAQWDDNDDGRITCAEARAHGIAPVRRDHPAYAYLRDGDGIVLRGRWRCGQGRHCAFKGRHPRQ